MLYSLVQTDGLHFNLSKDYLHNFFFFFTFTNYFDLISKPLCADNIGM